MKEVNKYMSKHNHMARYISVIYGTVFVFFLTNLAATLAMGVQDFTLPITIFSGLGIATTAWILLLRKLKDWHMIVDILPTLMIYVGVVGMFIMLRNSIMFGFTWYGAVRDLCETVVVIFFLIYRRQYIRQVLDLEKKGRNLE